jgi:hypothetical protein
MAGKPGGDKLVGGGIGDRFAQAQHEAHRDQHPQRAASLRRNQRGDDRQHAPPDQAIGQRLARAQLADHPAGGNLESGIAQKEGREDPAELDLVDAVILGEIGTGNGDVAAVQIDHRADQEDQHDQQVADFVGHHSPRCLGPDSIRALRGSKA